MVDLRPSRSRLSLGRHEQWVRIGLRVVLGLVLAALLVDIGLRLGHAGTARSASPTTQQGDMGAQAFASRCTVAALTFDETKKDEHVALLAPCLASGADPMLGWDGHGKQGVFSGPYVTGTDRRDGLLWVSEAAMVNGNRWVYLAVPVAAGRNGSYAIPAPPVTVPGPQQGNWTAPDTNRAVDTDMTAQRRDDIATFFRAYGLSDLGLAYFQAPGVSFQGLGAAATFDSMPNFLVYEGGSERTATATVRWHDPSGAIYTQGYRLQLKQVNGRWLVSDLAPAVLTGGGS